MKKLSISLLVMLLIASLFTSCSMGSDDASDVRVKVKITPSGGGRSLTTDIETINLDDDSITWHYFAKKVSEKQFNYGETKGSLLPKDGIVTLSQGGWDIGLWGIKDGKEVYTGTTNNVTIKWNFYEPNVTVPVPVKQNTGDKGYIVLTDVKIPVNEELKTPNYASIDTTIITNLNGANIRIECAPGSHTITFAYKEGESVKASKSLVVTVISGRETTISGNIEKGEITSGGSSAPTSEVQVIEVKKEAEVKVETSVAPATTSTPGTNTTVTFPAGSFNDDSSNAVLNLSVKSAGSEFSVTSSGTSVPVAGIDISLKVDDQEVTSFNGKEVVIETYIAKNLTSVSVKYNGTDGGQPTDVVYDRGTGKLVFKTTHFSEYYVLADEVEAYNTKLNKVYAKLQDAINAVSENKSNIVLLKDISQTETIVIPNDKNLILDLNGHTVTVNGTAILNNGTLEIKNGTVVSKTNVAICVGNASKTTIESGNYKGQEGAVITGTATGATINIKDGIFTATDNAVIAGNGTDRTGDPNIINISGGTFNGGITSLGYVACGIYAPWKDTINVSGGTFNITGGAGIVARAGNVNVTGGTFNCTGSVTGKVGDSRVVVPCSALVFDSEADYPAMTDNSKIVVSGGIFKTDTNVECIKFVQKEGDNNKRIEVSSGSFTDIVSAINYASDNAKIELLDNVQLGSNPIEIKKSIEINGNGYYIQCDNGDSNRVININDNTSDISLKITNTKIVGPTSGTYTRGISAYNNSGKLKIELDNCTVSANYYALNIASSNENVEVVVKNSTAVAGWCAVQSWSEGAKFTFENSTLIGNNDKTYNADGWNNFATIVINDKDTKNNEFSFKNCRIEANQTTGNKQYLMSVRSSGNKVSLDGCTYFENDTEIADENLGDYLSLYAAAIDLNLVIDGQTIPIR